MPFPWTQPTTIECYPADLVQIANDPQGKIWLNIIAVRKTTNGTLNVKFYNLFRIDDYLIPNITLHTEPINKVIRWDLSINTPSNIHHYYYNRIPTETCNADITTELMKYCSPLINTTWVSIQPGEPDTLVLRPTIIQDNNLPTVTVKFPILNTLDNLLQLEHYLMDKPDCHYEPCTSINFYYCPATLYAPLHSDSPHYHCVDKQCKDFTTTFDTPPEN